MTTTLRPALARLAASGPPPAPEPMTMYSTFALDDCSTGLGEDLGVQAPRATAEVANARRESGIATSERFNQLDQGTFVLVREGCTKIVALIDDKVGAFTERIQLFA